MNVKMLSTEHGGKQTRVKHHLFYGVVFNREPSPHDMMECEQKRD